MSLADKLSEDIKESMKARDKVRTGTLRMMLSELKYAQAAVGMGQTLDDAAVLKVFSGYHKKLAKSLEEFPEGEKRDAIREELAIVESYLPKKASASEVEAAIDQVMKATPEREFGVLMKQVLAKLGAGADGKMVSEAIRKKLA